MVFEGALDVDLNDLCTRVQNGEPITAIAHRLQLSRSTIYRRMNEIGLTRLTPTSDLNLLEVINVFQQNHPHDGFDMLLPYLRLRGIRVSHHRVRNTLRICRMLNPDAPRVR
jgi:hypothetical protein